MAKIRPSDAVKLMRDSIVESVANGDQEEWHADADEVLVKVLRSLGYDELCDIYDDLAKWYA